MRSKAASSKSAAKPRARATRDAAQTRARILAEATRIFAVSGFEGTSVNDIMKAARVNKRMLYHYYGDKEGLYRSIFLHQWSELKAWFDEALRRRVEESSGLPTDVRGILREAVDILFEFMAARNDFVRLLMWEGLEGGAISRAIWKDIRGPIYVQAEFLIRQAQQDGLLNKKLDPAHLVMSFLGAVGFYFAYAPALIDMIHKDPFSKAALEERKAQLQLLLESITRSPR